MTVKAPVETDTYLTLSEAEMLLVLRKYVADVLAGGPRLTAEYASTVKLAGVGDAVIMTMGCGADNPPMGVRMCYGPLMLRVDLPSPVVGIVRD